MVYKVRPLPTTSKCCPERFSARIDRTTGSSGLKELRLLETSIDTEPHNPFIGGGCGDRRLRIPALVWRLARIKTNHSEVHRM